MLYRDCLNLVLPGVLQKWRAEKIHKAQWQGKELSVYIPTVLILCVRHFIIHRQFGSQRFRNCLDRVASTMYLSDSYHTDMNALEMAFRACTQECQLICHGFNSIYTKNSNFCTRLYI